MCDDNNPNIQRRLPPPIGLLGTYPPPTGGVSVHIRALGQYLEDHGVPCVYYNTGPTKNIERKNVINILSTLDLISKLFRSSLKIFHVHGGGDYKKYIILFLFRVFFQKQYIITIHSGSVNEDIPKRSLLERYIISMAFKHADHLICVSEKIKKTITGIGVPEKLCSVIPAFAVNESLSDVHLPAEIQQFIDVHAPILSCVGFCFAPYYGFELAVEAIDRLKGEFNQIGLIIMGGNKSSEDYRRFMNALHQSSFDAVFITGDISHKNVLSVINQSDLFLRPTYHDGDANSVREAIAMGVPVVASDTEIRPAEAMLFRKGDCDDFVVKIREQLRAESKSRGKSDSIVDVSNLEAILNVYRSILS